MTTSAESAKMIEVLSRIIIVGVALFAGIALPFVPWAHAARFVNLFWGLVYGFGWFISSLVTGNIRVPAAVILGAIVWPIVLSIGLYVVSGIVWHGGPKVRFVFGLITLLSLFCVVSLDRTYEAPLNGFPLFSHFFFIDY
jgi:hypothetical protein